MVKYLVVNNIAYFPLQCALNSKPVMSAVLESLQHRGVRVLENHWEADAAIIWSVLWSGRMRDNRQVYEHYRRRGRPVIIVEIGALQRGRTWKISVNHVGSQGYYGHDHDLDLDRPRALGMKLEPVSRRGSHVVIAMQHARSLQTQDINLQQWLTNTVRAVRRFTDRPIVVRPHPRSPIQVPPDLGVTVQTPQKLPYTYDSFDLDLDCHAVVNINSGPGIQAAVAGVRPVVQGSSLAYPVRCDINMIDSPYEVDRDQWLIQICHTEYTVDEIQSGLWISRIEPALTVPV